MIISDTNLVHIENDLPLFPQDPEDFSVFNLCLADLSINASWPRRESAWPTAILQICKGFVRAFRLDNDSAVPAKIHEQVVRVRNRYLTIDTLTRFGRRIVPMRSPGRSDGKGGPMNPSHNIMVCSLWPKGFLY